MQASYCNSTNAPVYLPLPGWSLLAIFLHGLSGVLVILGDKELFTVVCWTVKIKMHIKQEKKIQHSAARLATDVFITL